VLPEQFCHCRRLCGQERLGLQPIEQFRHWLRVVALPGSQYKAQRVAQGVAHGMDFGVQATARYADGLRTAAFSCTCRGLVRLVAGRIHHLLLHVGLLYTMEKAREMAFFAPIRIAKTGNYITALALKKCAAVMQSLFQLAQHQHLKLSEHGLI
jgi:hypothetical protein